MKRGFFGKRGTKHKLFGVSLQEIMEHPDERGKKCPSLMEECFAVLQEKDALDIEGIFRQSASTVELEKLKALYSPGKCNKEQRLAGLRGASPIGVACLVKQFLRELPEPLLSKALSPLFISAGRTVDEKERNANLRLLLKNMPPVNRRVLRELVAFLQLVVDHSEQNRMTADNLGIVFAPTILYTDPGADSTALADAGVANSVVSCLIANYNELLPDEPLPLTPQRTPQATPAGTPTSPTPHTAAATPAAKAATPRTPLAVSATAPKRKKSRPSDQLKEEQQEEDEEERGSDEECQQEQEEGSSSDDGAGQEDEDEHEEEVDGGVGEDEGGDGDDEEDADDEDGNVPTKEMLEAYLTGIRKWEDEKDKLKRDLVAFDAAFAREHGGRMPTQQEKQPMKARYDQYQGAKAALEKLKAEYHSALARCPNTTEADILPHPYCKQSVSELRQTLIELCTQQRNQRSVLGRWRRDFEARHHRPPKSMVDFDPVQEQFEQHEKNKATIFMLRRYLDAHPQAK